MYFLRILLCIRINKLSKFYKFRHKSGHLVKMDSVSRYIHLYYMIYISLIVYAPHKFKIHRNNHNLFGIFTNVFGEQTETCSGSKISGTQTDEDETLVGCNLQNVYQEFLFKSPHCPATETLQRIDPSIAMHNNMIQEQYQIN